MAKEWTYLIQHVDDFRHLFLGYGRRIEALDTSTEIEEILGVC